MQKEIILLENKAVRCSVAVKTSIKDYQLFITNLDYCYYLNIYDKTSI